ncbi:MAG: thermonuclease family protein [Archangiaceae bacterium]|nr:thermonuclease family protein [Archangiaceae bacterium]
MRSVFFLAALVVCSACSTTRSGQRYSRTQATQLLTRLEVVALELGEFPIDGSASVVDGDTIKVRGLDSSLRLLALDTEETFKHESERRAFAAGWNHYKAEMRGESSRPVKYATPLGEDAKTWASAFFDGVTSVRLERDHPGEIRDYYGRYLAYVMVKKDGRWVNYNVECVRHGFSPYFVKYGRSRRFHREFVEAQKLAQQDKLGIWAPDRQHYDDYPERLKWWAAREASITRFEKQMEDRPESYIALTRWDAMLKLEQKLGKEVTLLGSVSEVKFGEHGPSLVRLSRNRGNDFDVVFWDKDVLLASGAQYKQGEYIQVRGVVNKYRDENRNVDRLQLVVSLPGQVLAPSRELETLLEQQPLKRAEKETEGD